VVVGAARESAVEQELGEVVEERNAGFWFPSY
jgi:hypothetical protein